MTDQSYVLRGVQQTIQILKDQGHKILLISSGIPDFVVKRLAKNVGAQYGIGIRVEMLNDLLTGYIAALDCRGQSKVDAIQALIESQHFENFEVIAVANDRNNIPLFRFADIPIGFRPDRVARRHVRIVVTTPDLRALLPYVSAPTVEVYVPRRLGQEIVRQLLHASAVIIPFLWLIHPSWHLPIFTLIGGLSLLFLISELARNHGIRIPLISTFVLAAGREDEIDHYVISPLYFAAGVALPLLIFGTLLPFPLIAATSVMVFLIGDAFSTIGGIFLGRHHYPFNPKKTIEGTLIGFSIACLFLMIIVSPLSALLCAIIAGIVELLPLPLDDNLAVPLITATLLTLFQVFGLYLFI
jgi:dolichol kinase